MTYRPTIQDCHDAHLTLSETARVVGVYPGSVLHWARAKKRAAVTQFFDADRSEPLSPSQTFRRVAFITWLEKDRA